MDKRTAAYELGFQSVMVRYGMLYSWRFGEELENTTKLPLQRLEQALRKLTSDIPMEVCRCLHQAIFDLGEVCRRMTKLYRKDVDKGTSRFGTGGCLGRPAWRALVELGGESLASVPWLKRWHRLGQAMGGVWLDLAADRTDEKLPDIMPILDAARELPESARAQVLSLDRCVKHGAVDARKRPAWVLARIVGSRIAHTGPNDAMVFTMLMKHLDKLDLDIRKHLARELRFELTLDDSDTEACQAVLNDRAYEISHPQLLFLRSLLGANGAWIRGRKIAKENGVLIAGTRIDRLCAGLPKAIRKFVESAPGHHHGYRLVLA